MRTYEGETFAEVYERVLNDVFHNAEYESSPRGMKIKEVTNAALVINDPLFPLYENERRGSQLKYIGAELLWYFTGRNDVDFIERFLALVALENDTHKVEHGLLCCCSLLGYLPSTYSQP